MTTLKFRWVVSAMIVCFFAAVTDAGTINLNDVYNGGNPFMSANYMWTDVVETNGPPNQAAFNFYRDPETIGESLLVNPTNFQVDVTPGPGLRQLDSQLEMVIMGKNGATIPYIRLRESGDYEINGQNPGVAIVRATVDYFYQILDGPSAGQTGNGIEVFEKVAAPSDTDVWMLGFNIPLPAGTTKVRFEFDNRLTAQAFADLSSAYIAKKVVDILVPEPTALTAMGVLLLGLAAGRRRWTYFIA